MKQVKTVPEEWTVDGLLEEICHWQDRMPERSIAFILGAGASVTSKIPAGGALAREWLDEAYHRQCLNKATQDLKSWASEKLNEPAFELDDVASFYPRVFELRFGGDRQAGYAALESKMKKAEPGLGYSILAKILEGTRNKVVITTNFDNLIADALAMLALTSPLIVGHESLAGFVRPHVSRPLVAKIHRDLLFHPINDQDGVDTLEEGWKEAWSNLLQHCTPLVIGYGGNDGSLMGFLQNLETGHIPGRLFWCYRKGDKPKQAILDVVSKHHGVMIAIEGFDEFMVSLALKLIKNFELNDLAKDIKNIGEQRAERFIGLIEKLVINDKTSSTRVPGNIKSTLSKASHDEDQWWTWQLRADAENEPKKQDAIYRAGLDKLPNSAELCGNYALFLEGVLNDYDGAEAMYKRAQMIAPNTANILGNYALFLQNIRKDYDAAEALYQRAIDIDSSNTDLLANYAYFLLIRGTANAFELATDQIKLVVGGAQNEPSQALAEALFYECIISELTNKVVGFGTGRLKHLFALGYERGDWSFDALLDSHLQDITSERQQFYIALGEAVLDAAKVAKLDDFQVWRDIEPLDPFSL